MERLIEFQGDTTRYLVSQEGQWGFFATVKVTDRDAVNLDVEIVYREMPGLRNVRRFVLTTEEGLCLEMVRGDGRQDDVTILLDAVEGSQATLRFEVPDGVTLELVENDADATAS